MKGVDIMVWLWVLLGNIIIGSVVIGVTVLSHLMNAERKGYKALEFVEKCLDSAHELSAKDNGEEGGSSGFLWALWILLKLIEWPIVLAEMFAIIFPEWYKQYERY